MSGTRRVAALAALLVFVGAIALLLRREEPAPTAPATQPEERPSPGPAVRA